MGMADCALMNGALRSTMICCCRAVLKGADHTLLVVARAWKVYTPSGSLAAGQSGEVESVVPFSQRVQWGCRARW